MCFLEVKYVCPHHSFFFGLLASAVDVLGHKINWGHGKRTESKKVTYREQAQNKHQKNERRRLPSENDARGGKWCIKVSCVA